MIVLSLMIISSMWYIKFEFVLCFFFWYFGLGFGQIIGGFVLFGFQYMGFDVCFFGWCIMFLIFGLFIVVVGFCVIIFFFDIFMQVKWMFDNEKVVLLKYVSVNQIGVENCKFCGKEILEVLIDFQVYFLFFVVILVSYILLLCLGCGEELLIFFQFFVFSGVVIIYLVIFICNFFGYDFKKVVFMNIFFGVVSIFFILLVGWGICFQFYCWVWIIVCIFLVIVGGGFMSFLFKDNINGILVGIYFVNVVVVFFVIFYNWIVVNIVGVIKCVFVVVIISGFFFFGNIIGFQIFQVCDVFDYCFVKFVVMGIQVGCVFVIFVFFFYYVW